MPRLLRVELTVPGEYRDLWLYKEALHLWDREGVLRYVRLDVALKLIAQIRGNSIANLVQLLIFRNDWKVGEQFVSWMRVPEVEGAAFRSFVHSDSLVIELPRGIFARVESETYGGMVLDTQIYANRVYFATAEGLLESYINPKHIDRAYGLNQQTDFHASRVAVKYSAINVSAESQGLHFAPVGFWDITTAPIFKKANWRQIADYSLASSFASRNLLNYTRDPSPSLLRSQVEEHQREGRSYVDTSIVGYESDATNIGALTYSAAAGSRKMTASKVPDSGQAAGVQFEVIGNSDYHLLINWDWRLRVIDLREATGRELEARPSRKFDESQIDAGGNEEILATYPINQGFIVEFYDRLDIITTRGSFPLWTGEAAQVRTFDNSIRHKEAVAVIKEQSASVFGYYITNDAPADGLFDASE